MRAILPTEGLGAKIGKKLRTFKNEIKLSGLDHSIRLDELIISMCSDVKIR